MSDLETVQRILASTLQLGERAAQLTADTELLGNIPELDSMAVVTVLTAIEEEYGMVIDDDEVSADIFATVGTLTDFVTSKSG